MKRKSKYYCRCGICNELFNQEDMEKDFGSETGWLCYDCFMIQHPEFDIEEW